MAPKRNNMIPNGHFHKDWQRNVKTWFNQPARKFRRRTNRITKARAVAPRPARGALRPVVRCPTFRYHTKIRAGRGFTLDELKGAKLNPKFARSVGVSIDYRRRNKSVQSLQQNIQRLKEYQSKLVLFPLNGKKIRKGEASSEEQKLATQLRTKTMAIRQPPAKLRTQVPTKKQKKFSPFNWLRKCQTDARLVGIRAKRIKDAAENPDDLKLAAKDAKKAKK